MKRVIISGVLMALFCASAVLAADRMRIAYSSISGAYVGHLGCSRRGSLC